MPTASGDPRRSVPLLQDQPGALILKTKTKKQKSKEASSQSFTVGKQASAALSRPVPLTIATSLKQSANSTQIDVIYEKSRNRYELSKVASSEFKNYRSVNQYYQDVKFKIEPIYEKRQEASGAGLMESPDVPKKNANNNIRNIQKIYNKSN